MELIEKLEKEAGDLWEKTVKLEDTLEKKPNYIPEKHMNLLHAQYTAMYTYYILLITRIDILKDEKDT